MDATPRPVLDRRTFMASAAVVGLGTAFADALWAQAREVGTITLEMLPAAEAVVGLEFTQAERELMLDGLNEQLESYTAMRAVAIPNDVAPALHFQPVRTGAMPPSAGRAPRMSRHPEVTAPARLEEVAFWPVTRLSELIRSRQVTSEALTRMYLERLKRYGPRLECVVTLTEERGLTQARLADEEIARGHWRGPLHGIPWGAKDLLAAKDHRTTWGAKPYEDQWIHEDATVVRRLDEAGAVLVAKLTLGALAWGDVWFGGLTRNPWNLEQGSSGSSAGSAAATVAGLVGFAIGSETLGSIVSPCTRTGATGLRPTFGRVSRAGAMALSWSMDKLGPICRSVEDCALVLEAIAGPDGRDPTVHDVAFDWDPDVDPSRLRVGYLASAFEEDHATKPFDDAALGVLRGMGLDPMPIALPQDPPAGPLGIILSAEAGAAFDELTRSGKDDLLVRQIENAWPNVFRQARLIPAVEYINANRIRTMLMGAMERSLEGIDVFVTPSFGGNVLLITNLTGHPCVVLPNGFTAQGTPVSLSFVGNLWKDAEALAVAKAYQDATGFHERRPPGFA